MVCSCSATIGKPSNVVTKRRLKKAECFTRNALWYDWTTLVWLNQLTVTLRWVASRHGTWCLSCVMLYYVESCNLAAKIPPFVRGKFTPWKSKHASVKPPGVTIRSSRIGRTLISDKILATPTPNSRSKDLEVWNSTQADTLTNEIGTPDPI